jgi:hypothetical protein
VLKTEQLKILQELLLSDDTSFAALVKISKLDKKRDFRFGDFRGLDLRDCDLSGFDFTGSDLRGCIINEKTIISETTILTNADIEWIHAERTPIHQKMFEIERSGSSPDRRRRLDELINNYSSDTHIHLFLKQMIAETRSIETLFDLLDYFQARSEDDEFIVARKLVDVTLGTVRIRHRKSAMTHSPTSFQNVISRIQQSNNETLRRVFVHYLQSSEALGFARNQGRKPAGPRPPSPREGALRRWSVELRWEGLGHKVLRSSVGAPARGRARPCVEWVVGVDVAL